MKNVLYILLLLLLVVDVSAQIEFNGKTYRFDGVVLFQAADDPFGYYYLPDKLNISKDKDGRKIMSHYKYVSEIDSLSDSMFYVELNFNIDPPVLQSAKHYLDRANPGAYMIGKLPLYNIDQKKQVFSKLKLESAIFKNVVEGYAPIFNYATAAFSLRMNKDESALFEKSLSLVASDLSLSFESYMYANVKDCMINISAAKKELQLEFLDMKLDQEEVKAKLNDMLDNSDLKLESNCSSKIESQLSMDVVMDYITAMMFEEDQSESDKYVFKSSILDGTKEFSLTINSTTQLKLPYSASCNLTLDEGELIKEYQDVIDLNSRERNNRELIFQMTENIEEAFDQSINKLEVELKQNGKVLNDRLCFTATDIKNGFRKKSKLVNLDSGDINELEYRLIWGVKKRKEVTNGPWRKAELFNTLIPPLNELSTTIIFDHNLFSDYRFVKYDFYAQDKNGTQLKLLGAVVNFEEGMSYRDVHLYYPEEYDLLLTSTFVPKDGAQKENIEIIKNDMYTIFIKPPTNE